MTEKADILIIGGGAIGICCAHFLNRLGRQVMLVEKAELGAGASQGNAGLVIPGQSIPLAAPGVISKGLKWMLDPESPFYIKPRVDLNFYAWLWKFSRHCTEDHLRRAVPVMGELQKSSIALFKELAEIDHIDMGFVQAGVVDAYRSRDEFDKGKQTARFLQNFKLSNRILDKPAIDAMFPGLRNNFVGGIHYHQDGHLIPERFVRALADHVQQHGTVIRTGVEVIGMKRSGRRITSVQTTRGDIRAEEIVLAAGAWSPQIAQDLKLKLMVQPAKGYSITYRRPEPFPEIPVILVEAKVAVTPMDANLRFAGTLELAGWDFSIKRRRVGAILNSIPRYLPDIDPQQLKLIEIWRGPRPCTPDGLPYIGRPGGIDNLIVAAGHAMKGISLAPITGQLVARLAAHEQPDFDMRALSIERFA